MPENLGALFDDRPAQLRNIARSRTVLDAVTVGEREGAPRIRHATADFAQGSTEWTVPGATLAELTGIQPDNVTLVRGGSNGASRSRQVLNSTFEPIVQPVYLHDVLTSHEVSADTPVRSMQLSIGESSRNDIVSVRLDSEARESEVTADDDDGAVPSEGMWPPSWEPEQKCICDRVLFFTSTGTSWTEHKHKGPAIGIEVSADGRFHTKAYIEIHTLGPRSNDFDYEIMVKAGADEDSPASALIGIGDKHVERMKAKRTAFSVWGNAKCMSALGFPIEVERYTEEEADKENRANAAAGIGARVTAGDFKQGSAWLHVVVEGVLCGLFEVIVSSHGNPCSLSTASKEAEAKQKLALEAWDGVRLNVPDRVVYNSYRSSRQLERQVSQRVADARRQGNRADVIAATREFAVEVSLIPAITCAMIHHDPNCCCAYVSSVELKLQIVIHSLANSPGRNPDIPATTGSAAEAFWMLTETVRDLFLSVPPQCRFLEKPDCEAWCQSGRYAGCPAEMNDGVAKALDAVWQQCLSLFKGNPRSADRNAGNVTKGGYVMSPTAWSTASLVADCEEVGDLTLLIYDLVGVDRQLIDDMVASASNILLQCCVRIASYTIDKSKQVKDPDRDYWGYQADAVAATPGRHLVIIGPQESSWVKRHLVGHPGTIALADLPIASGKVGKRIAMWGDGVGGLTLAHELGHNAGILHLGHGPAFVMNAGVEAGVQGMQNLMRYYWTPQDCRSLRRLPEGMG